MTDPTAGLVAILRRTLPWVHLLSYACFVAVGFFALLGGMWWAGLGTAARGHVPLQVLVVYPILMILAFVPAWHLRKCARRLQVFVAQGHIVQLEAALDAQRAVWKFAGLVVILMGALAIVAMVVGVLAAL
jgi:hypothetical protein